MHQIDEAEVVKTVKFNKVVCMDNIGATILQKCIQHLSEPLTYVSYRSVYTDCWIPKNFEMDSHKTVVQIWR